MSKVGVSTKKRLILALVLTTVLIMILIIRVGFLQLKEGDWLRNEAMVQQTRDIPLEAKRGTIFDRNGKELAISITKNTVWAKPVEILDKKHTATVLSQILGEDENEIYKKITKKNIGLVKIKRWIENEQSVKIRKARLSGIWVAQDNKRYYPFGNFASYVLGHVSADNVGVSGFEMVYNKFLKGFKGRLVVSTDASGREIPFESEKYHESKDGLSAILTIDEVIQHYAEKAVSKAQTMHNAKRVHAIVMDPKTGDILAMVSKPDYTPNDPRNPIYPLFEEELKNYSDKDILKGWFKMWRNPTVNDTYEPGSTFKLITSSAGIQEGVVTPDEEFYDRGFVMVGDRRIKCWRYYNPHGKETFTQAVQNSCNPVFVEIGQRLGVDKLYEYINAFGLTKPTGIDLPGEEKGLMYNKKYVGPVELATISFGQSISITPIQLITAVSAIANGGKLMKPRIVKEFVDEKGNVIKKIDPLEKRRVISEQTSQTMRTIMESVVSEGSGKVAYLPGYRVGGKTGTAQKVVDGRYAQGRYITSFIGIAPANNPRVVVLAILDEPQGSLIFGSTTAGPIVKEIMYDTLKYLEVKPQYTKDEEDSIHSQQILIPDVRNLTLENAGKILSENKIQYSVEPNMYADANSKILDMFPKPLIKVPINSNIILFTDDNKKSSGNPVSNKVKVPDVNGKTIKEAADLIKKSGLKIKIIGNGLATLQNPIANTEVDTNTIITVEFK